MKTTSRAVLLKLRDVNPSSPLLTVREGNVLRALLAERDRLACRGLWREAAAMGVATLTVWRGLASPSSEVPDTSAGDL